MISGWVPEASLVRHCATPLRLVHGSRFFVWSPAKVDLCWRSFHKSIGYLWIKTLGLWWPPKITMGIHPCPSNHRPNGRWTKSGELVNWFDSQGFRLVVGSSCETPWVQFSRILQMHLGCHIYPILTMTIPVVLTPVADTNTGRCKWHASLRRKSSWTRTAQGW
jgi:hypothetical protein